MRLLLVLFVIALSSCLTPPDIPICRDLPQRRIATTDPFGVVDIELKPNPLCEKEIGEDSCGFCAYTIKQKTFYIGNTPKNLFNGKSWSAIKDDGVILPVESYAEIKKYILIMCKKRNDCGGDMGHWQSALDRIRK